MRHLILESDQLVAALNAAMDQGTRAAVVAEKLKIYNPGGPYMYAPVDERRKAEQAIQRDLDTRASHALYRVRRFLLDHDVELAGAVAAAQEPPDAEAAWERRTGRRGGSQEGTLLLGVLDELRRQRLSHELSNTTPSVVLAAYKRALADPDEQSNATTIKYVEAKHAAGWAGASSASESEIAAVLALGTAIISTREARVPEDLRAIQAAFTRASMIASTVEAIGVRARKPDLDLEGE